MDSRGRAKKGSQAQVQVWVNRYQRELSEAIVSAIPALRSRGGLHWTSPLEDDHFYEYQDEAFLEKLGLDEYSEELKRFWPPGGPCWDALATTREKVPAVLLVEGKSRPGETSAPMRAVDPVSIERINLALFDTAAWLDVRYDSDAWTNKLYQTANRLAHLRFLREVCNVEAWLVHTCFVNDKNSPTTGGQWRAAFPVMWAQLGLSEPPPCTVQVVLQARADVDGDLI